LFHVPILKETCNQSRKLLKGFHPVSQSRMIRSLV
jgi:hypothetical protein